ncbi:hypothetical protein ACWEJ6_40875 [Nonomuraea sp. NPDC004702]
MGDRKNPNSPQEQPFKPDPSAITPDGNRESQGRHGDGKDGKGGKK